MYDYKSGPLAGLLIKSAPRYGIVYLEYFANLLLFISFRITFACVIIRDKLTKYVWEENGI
jgi:hypothetical protein